MQRSFSQNSSTSAQTNASASVENSSNKPSLILSETCKKRLSVLSAQEDNKFLRIIVDGGGCSGFQYKFELDNKINDDDVIFGENNCKIVIDKVSLDYCAGSTIDYHTELIKSGFRVIGNPKAEQGCSCGASFALKLD